MKTRLPFVVPSWIATTMLCILGVATAQARIPPEKSKDAILAIQKQLASPRRGDALEKEYLRRLRVDQLSWSGTELSLSGVSLDFTNFRSKNDRPWAAIIEAGLQEIVKDTLELPQGWKFKPGFTNNFSQIKFQEQPHFLMQSKSNEMQLDDVLLVTNAFDDQGELRLEGMVGSLDSQKKMMEIARQILQGNKAIRGQLDPVLLARIVAPVTRIDWDVGGPQIQQWFAGSDHGDRRLHAVRLDRSYFRFEEIFNEDAQEKRWGLSFQTTLLAIREGVATAKDENSKDSKPLPAVLSDRFEVLWPLFIKRRWPVTPLFLNSKPRMVSTVEDVAFNASRDALQKAIAGKPDLDGTVVWGRSRFNSTGQLVLNGMCDRTEALASTATAIAQVLKELKSRLAERGVDNSQFVILNTRGILNDLADWTAKSQDDLRLNRLYFNSDYVLELNIDSPSNAATNIVSLQFKQLLLSLGVEDKLRSSRQNAGVVAGAMAPVALTVITSSNFKASLSNDLQKFFAGKTRDVDWRGILVSRGFFDRHNHNRYSMNIILDEGDQQDRVQKLVVQYLTQQLYAGYLATPSQKPQFFFEVISTKKLVEQLRAVMPAYPIFDSFRVDDAVHDAEANLVLIVAGVGTPDLLEPAPGGKDPIGPMRSELKKMLDNSPKWRKRSAVRLHSRLLFEYGARWPVPFDYDLGPLTAIRISRHVFDGDRKQLQEDLNTALLHNPNNSTLWFLSGTFHMLAQREDLAYRDLRRVVLLEKDPTHDPIAAAKFLARVKTIEPFQGTDRHRVEKMLDKEYTDYYGNKPVIKLQ